MKDKNQLVGWLLITLVFCGWMAYSSHDASQQQIERNRLDSIRGVEQAKQKKIEEAKALAEAKQMQAEMTDSLNPLFQARQNVAGKTVIKNEFLSLTINNKGGQIEKAELLDEKYKGKEGGNVILFDGDDCSFDISIDGKTTNISTTDFFFVPTQATENAVTMSLPIAGGSLDISYSLIPGSYLVNMDVQANMADGFFSSKTRKMILTWSEKMKQQEKGYEFENRYATITYRETDDDTNELDNTGADKEKDDFDNKVHWISFKDQFFSQVLIAESPMAVNKMSSKQIEKGKGYLKTYSTELESEFDPTGKKATSFKIYLGPNKFTTLRENEELINSDTNLDLQSLVYLGWPIIRWVNRYFIIYFFDFLTSWGLNMGIVLLLLTIAMKILVFPLMRKSQLASSKMRVLRPKIDEISAKYPRPEDAMQKQQEIMQLYSEYGSNPMSGCLPMLIQMPIWIALFNFIPNAIELRGESFLWADDLSTYDDIINWGFNIWGIGDHLSLFCILWCVSTVASSWFSMRQQQDSMTPEQAQQMGMMKWMSYIMPLMFFFMFNSYSSGLNYYYFLSSLISVIMMWYLRKTTDEVKLLAQLEENRKRRKEKAVNGKKPSSMFTRMQELQQKQLEMLKEQQEKQNKQKK